MSEELQDQAERAPAPRELSRPQRRTLGVLIEKAMTTPDQYPLTLKSCTAGCNQKSNRDPVTSYSEEQVERFLTELRHLGLVAVVHTEGGRTERFRHYARKAYPWSEPQLAIMAELWLRGRQQLGELRSRAGRMAAIETLEQLRTELAPLIEQGYVQSNGSLDRRGVEVDHHFYLSDEGKRLEPAAQFPDEESDDEAVATSVPRGASALAALEERVSALEGGLSELRDELHALRRELGAS
ncbi:MAG: DUF480 domain-containing protein [Planctomyces sp.]|nr:DUF480 domain-containing protein [Planctomyces sp.]